MGGGNVGGRGWAGWSGVKGGKWDNCNSVINKYILKKIFARQNLNSNTKCDAKRLGSLC